MLLELPWLFIATLVIRENIGNILIALHPSTEGNTMQL